MKVVRQSLSRIGRIGAAQLSVLDLIMAKRTEGTTREMDEEDLRVCFGCKYEANQRDMVAQNYEEL